MFKLFKTYSITIRKENRVKTYSIIFVIFFILDIFFYIFLSIFLNITNHNYLDCLLIILFDIVLYFIICHSLLDIRTTIRKGFVYMCLVGFVYIIFYFVTFLFTSVWGSVFTEKGYIIGLFLAPLSVLLFLLAQRYLNGFVNRYLFASVYNTQKTLEDLSNTINSMIDIEDIFHSIFYTLKEILAVDKVAIIIKDSDGKNYQIVRNYSFKQLDDKKIFNNNFIIDWFSKEKRLVIREELETVIPDILNARQQKDFQKLAMQLKKLEVNLCLPMMRHDKLVGLILLGKKNSKEAYFNRDIELLSLVANQSAVAIENAQFYHEMEELVKSKTRELRDKNKNLKELLDAQSSFLTTASHQLRTPISIAKSMLSMLNAGTLPEDKKKYFIERSFVAIDHLSNIVHDILSASAIEVPNFKLNKELTNVGELINKIIEERVKIVKEKNIELIYHQPEEAILPINIDAIKIKEVIANLIDNAIQYTFSGSIEINTKIEDKNFVFIIKDTGIGIDKKDINKLFKKISRLPNAIKVRAEGTGLGLFFVKQVVLAHDGKIEVYSENTEGAGSTFTFWLPIK